MSMSKEETIEKYGKKDGLDESRWQGAIQMAGEIDKSPVICFERLRKLEDDGQIVLAEGPPPQAPVVEKNGTVFLDEQDKCLKVLIDGEMVKYPTLEEFGKILSQLEAFTKPNWVQSIAQGLWKTFLTKWTRGDYKDKAITMEACYMMGFKNGWNKKEEEIHKAISGE